MNHLVMVLFQETTLQVQRSMMRSQRAMRSLTTGVFSTHPGDGQHGYAHPAAVENVAVTANMAMTLVRKHHKISLILQECTSISRVCDYFLKLTIAVKSHNECY